MEKYCGKVLVAQCTFINFAAWDEVKIHCMQVRSRTYVGILRRIGSIEFIPHQTFQEATALTPVHQVLRGNPKSGNIFLRSRLTSKFIFCCHRLRVESAHQIRWLLIAAIWRSHPETEMVRSLTVQAYVPVDRKKASSKSRRGGNSALDTPNAEAEP